jgi:hypothetical protein
MSPKTRDAPSVAGDEGAGSGAVGAGGGAGAGAGAVVTLVTTIVAFSDA